MRHALFTLITLCVLSLFPVCPAHDAGHDGGEVQQKAGFPEKRSWTGKFPPCFKENALLKRESGWSAWGS